VPWALFLDVDGTILDLHEVPSKVQVPADLIGVLGAAACTLDGALAFVSGRAIGDLDRLFAPLKVPAAGQHGAEIRPAAGRPVRKAPQASVDREVARRIEALALARPAIEVENKGLTLAVHYRRVPEAAAHLESEIRRVLTELRSPLSLMPGNMVWEIKDTRYTKATAVETLMRRKPFRGRVPIFVGDDVADEDGFAAAERFGGLALPVGRVHSPRRRAAFAEPKDVRDWLATIPRQLAKRESHG
jgi:trehalose 6-phosphate phosphatase